MRENSYSETWKKNSRLIQSSLDDASPLNFYLGSSFAGLYERPSPFPYRKHTKLGALREDSNVVSRGRDWFLLKSEEMNLRLGLRFGGLKALEMLLPPKTSFERTNPPFFWSFSQQKMNGPYLKAAEQVAILLSVEGFRGANTVCEIGAGFGALAETVIHNLKPRKYVIIDLPEMLDVSFGYLSASVPGARLSDPFKRRGWEQASITIGGTEITFIDATEIHRDLPKNIDLFLNSSSFAEMETGVLDSYLNLIESNPGTMLLSANPMRVEGSSVFDPDGFAAGRRKWKLLARAEQRSHPSLRGIIVTVHSIGAS